MKPKEQNRKMSHTVCINQTHKELCHIKWTTCRQKPKKISSLWGWNPWLHMQDVYKEHAKWSERCLHCDSCYAGGKQVSEERRELPEAKWHTRGQWEIRTTCGNLWYKPITGASQANIRLIYSPKKGNGSWYWAWASSRTVDMVDK